MIHIVKSKSDCPTEAHVGHYAVLDLNCVYPAWGSVFKITKVTPSSIRGETVPRLYLEDEQRYIMRTSTMATSSGTSNQGGDPMQCRHNRVRAICTTLEEVNVILAQSNRNERAYHALCETSRRALEECEAMASELIKPPARRVSPR